MSFKFDPLTQAFIEIKEPTRLERFFKIPPASPLKTLNILAVMGVMIAAALFLLYYNLTTYYGGLEYKQSIKHITINQGVLQ